MFMVESPDMDRRTSRPFFTFSVEEKNIHKDGHQLRKRDIIAGHVSTTSMHGIPRIYGSYGWVKKGFWCLALLTALGLCLYNIALNVISLLSYDVTTSVSIYNERTLKFPAVTVCNINPYRLSVLPESYLKYLRNSSLASGSVYDKGPRHSDGGLGESKSSRLATQEVITELLAHEPLHTRMSYGHQFEEFLLQCDYDGYDCSSTTQWRALYNWKFGNCFSFNTNMSTAIFTSHLPGPDHGLRIVLNTQLAEYAPTISSMMGARVVIHDHYNMPFPEDAGLNVAPGASVAIGLRKLEISRLGSPYGLCRDTTASNLEVNAYEEINGWTNYSTAACQKTCYQKLVISRCDCFDPAYPSFGQAFTSSVTEPCSNFNSTQVNCVDAATDIYLDALSCAECISSCSETTYSLSTSSTMWPAPTYEETLLDSLDPRIPTVQNMKNGSASVSSNLMQVEIYYEDLNFESISESASYTGSQFLSDLGGSAGLWIGASVLSVAELIELLIDFMSLMIFKHCAKVKARNSIDMIKVPQINGKGV